MNALAFFDLEGPLSPQDNAYEVSAAVAPEGRGVFAALSRYDDLLTLDGRPNYEPGDTLGLALPVWVRHGFEVGLIAEVSQDTTHLMEGARSVVDFTRERAHVHIVTSSFAAHAELVATRLGVDRSHVHASVLLPAAIDEYRSSACADAVTTLEASLARSGEPSDEDLVQRMDRFYYRDLLGLGCRHPSEVISVRGGRRKVSAITGVHASGDVPWENTLVVGDSITDAAAFRFADAVGGVAIAFNANEFALPFATVGASGVSLEVILPVIDAWSQGGRAAVHELVRGGGAPGCEWLGGAGGDSWTRAVDAHRANRLRVREGAGWLG